MVLAFEQMSNTQLYAVLKLRCDVFVVEQECVYPDLDDKDTLSGVKHLLCYEQDELIAYARLLPPTVSYPSASIGRVVVSAKHRGEGLARQLMSESINHTFALFQTENIEIGAQAYLQSFYESLGFVPSSDLYDEDGIMHIDMCLSK